MTVPEPYSSLNALRQANDELLGSQPEDESRWSEIDRQTAEAQTKHFLERAVETGTVLDMPADRKAAQALINYWTARPYTLSSESCRVRPLLGREDTLLKAFDPVVMRSVVERSDAFLQALPPKDQALARRILLRLLQVSNGASALSPRIKASLFSGEEEERANQILAKLRDAGAIVIGSPEQGSLVELRYEALVRHWQRLQAWIDERIKFRDAAFYWGRTERDNGALLSAKLASTAAEYGDLSDLEKEFVKASRKHTTCQRAAFGVAAVLPVMLLILAWLVYEPLSVYWKTPGKTEAARSSDQPVEDRVAAIRWLARHQVKPDLSNISLTRDDGNPIDLKKLKGPQWNFVGAAMRNVDLSEGDLPAAQFSESSIARSHFKKANLEKASFAEARISSTSFSNSKLNNAVFDSAQLCDVDFSESDLSEVSFRRVRYDDLPDLRKTAWWLASGWTLEQVDAITKRFGGASPDIKGFRSRLEKSNKKLETNQDPATFEYVKARDELGWTCATYGMDICSTYGIDRKALDAAKEAYERAKELKIEPYVKGRLVSYAADTLGYLLMQKGQIEEALPLLEQAGKSMQNPGATFRYALALNKNGNEERAIESLSSAIKRGYLPTHELYLLRKLFSQSGNFNTAFASHQPEPEKPPPGGWCH